MNLQVQTFGISIVEQKHKSEASVFKVKLQPGVSSFISLFVSTSCKYYYIIYYYSLRSC